MTARPVTVGEALGWLEPALARAGIDSPRAEALTLLAHLLDLPRTMVTLSLRRDLSDADVARLQGWVARRVAREPLQHILGTAPFYGLDVGVTPAVLIPRPETEVLVHLALETLRDVRDPVVLDVGTGSGAIALAIKAERPDAAVTASDVSAAALAVAHDNAVRLGLGVRFVVSDLLDDAEIRQIARRADVVISNPPYLPRLDAEGLSPEVRADPALALFSGEGGLEHFRRLQQSAYDLLTESAYLMVELDPRNVGRAAALATAKGWAEVSVHPDLSERDRFLSLRR
ncbi:MAG: peptide chain release factor N(5)-glutamine methyltransferase [Trueperaceae bacterium]|nr:peptide chain release factor N(5)-glutamine methyltransferase [Trueperaceae bacterium]